MAQTIARERIERLFDLAEKRFQESETGLADRYVELARKIGMKAQVSIPEEYRKRFCSECHAYLKPGINARVRINSKDKTVNYYCEECGNVDRYGF